MPIKLTISGTERKPKSHSLNITTRLNGRATCSFIHVHGVPGLIQVDFRPTVGETVEVYELNADNSLGTKYFAGTIHRIAERMRTTIAVAYEIECVDFGELADRFLVGTFTDQIAAKAYKDEAAGAIVRDILNVQSFLFAEGVTEAEIQDGPIITKAIFGQNPYGRYVREAFDYLALQSNFTWWIDYDKGLHFIERPPAQDAPFTIADTLLNFRNFRASFSREEYGNRIWLAFNPEAVGPEVETFSGDGVATTFTLSFPAANVVGITLNGDPQTIALRSDVDAVVHWSWEPGEKEITQGAASEASSATLTFTGLPSNGQTATINGKVYTFQTTLTDVDGNVLRGADADSNAQNLRAAINLDAGAGTTYAASTTAHTSVTATNPELGKVTVTMLIAGDELTVAENLSNATWSTPTSTILTADDVLEVSYRPIGQNLAFAADQIAADAIAAIQGGTGYYELFIDEPELMDANSVEDRVNALLRHYLAVGDTAEFDTDLESEPLAKNLEVGQLINVTISKHNLLSKLFLVESIVITDNGMDLFYFHVNLVGGEFGDDLLRFFERLAEKGAGSGTGIGGGSSRTPQRAIFNLLGTLRVKNDATLRHQATSSGSPREALINAITPPTGANIEIDLLVKNPGDTAWESIFQPDKLLVLSPGEEIGDRTEFASPLPRISRRGRLRCDVKKVGSTEPGKDVAVTLSYL